MFLDFLPSRQLFEYGNKINLKKIVSDRQANILLAFARSTIRTEYSENIPTAAFRCLWESPTSKASRNCCTTASNSTGVFHIILACLSSMCNSTSSSQFQHFEHQSLSGTVLSGIHYQVFSNNLWMCTVVHFLFETIASWLSYYTDIKQIAALMVGGQSQILAGTNYKVHTIFSCWATV